MAIVCSVVAGCAVDGDTESESVASAWQRRGSAQNSEQQPQRGTLSTLPPRRPLLTESTNVTNSASVNVTDFDTIATVDGQAISRRQVVDLLLRGHGPSLLNQLAVLERAQALAADRGLALSSADVEREYNRTLNRLANPLVSISSNQVDRKEAEAVLTEILSKRNISREEFDLTVRRNALLRKLANSQLHFTQAQIKAEHVLMIERKAEVRHIQIATHAELSRILARLASGEDFAKVARKYSANTASAPKGGLLSPFAQLDDRVPELLRKTAFELESGEQADPIRMGAWYHIVKLVQMIPAKPTSIKPKRDEIEARLQDRLADAAMQKLYEKLQKEAKIEIHDPVLRQAYEQRSGKLPKRP